MNKHAIRTPYNAALAQAYTQQSKTVSQPDTGRQFLRDNLLDLDRGALIVDIGCGNGADLKSYAAMGFSQLVGVEPSANFRAQAKDLLGDTARICAGSFESLPLPDAYADAIVSRFSLHYCADLAKAWRESARVLKPKGKFLAIVSHPAADQAEPRDANGNITITLFGGTVEITYPAHNGQDYYSDVFRSHFRVKRSLDYCGSEQDRGKNGRPNSLCIAAYRLG